MPGAEGCKGGRAEWVGRPAGGMWGHLVARPYLMRGDIWSPDPTYACLPVPLPPPSPNASAYARLGAPRADDRVLRGWEGDWCIMKHREVHY